MASQKWDWAALNRWLFPGSTLLSILCVLSRGCPINLRPGKLCHWMSFDYVCWAVCGLCTEFKGCFLVSMYRTNKKKNHRTAKTLNAKTFIET